METKNLNSDATVGTLYYYKIIQDAATNSTHTILIAVCAKYSNWYEFNCRGDITGWAKHSFPNGMYELSKLTQTNESLGQSFIAEFYENIALKQMRRATTKFDE